MKTVKMEVELTYNDNIFGGDEEEIEFFKEILTRYKNTLFNHEVGDEVGEVKVIKMGLVK
jgi:hypothetical protein